MSRAAAWVGAVLLAFALPATAASVYLEDLTSPELRDAIASGKTTILVPIGGTEQNGAHMALGKHNARVRVLARRIAGELGNAIVAPVLAYVPEGGIDPPTGHMRSPGTITVPEEVFEKVIESAARGFRLHGFGDVVFLGDSGDYQRNLKSVAARLNRAWASGPARAHALEAYYRASGIKEHAGKEDSSLTLALDPALVRAPLAPPGTTAESGRAIADRIVAESVRTIREATRR